MLFYDVAAVLSAQALTPSTGRSRESSCTDSSWALNSKGRITRLTISALEYRGSFQIYPCANTYTPFHFHPDSIHPSVGLITVDVIVIDKFGRGSAAISHASSVGRFCI
jgi:hypothetical protein